MEFIADNYCFGCGQDNPYGLKLIFDWDGDKYYTDFYADNRYQSYKGVLHGGIISTILDELMARYLIEKGLGILTASMEVRFKKRVPTGITVRFMSWQKEKNRDIYIMAASVFLPEGEVAAEATAKFIRAGEFREIREAGKENEDYS